MNAAVMVTLKKVKTNWIRLINYNSTNAKHEKIVDRKYGYSADDHCREFTNLRTNQPRRTAALFVNLLFDRLTANVV